MDATRRGLMKAGLASVPIALMAPKIFGTVEATSTRNQREAADPFLDYLIADTRRNIHVAQSPGRDRAAACRALGANAEVLTAYLLSRHPHGAIKQALRRRGQPEALALSAQEAWPVVASSVERDFGVKLAELDAAHLTRAANGCYRFGFPRVAGLRRPFEREAERIERWEGHAAATPIRQTPGNDYGPDGWAIGSGDPGGSFGCYELGILIAVLAVLCCVPELQGIVGPILAALGLVQAIACAD